MYMKICMKSASEKKEAAAHINGGDNVMNNKLIYKIKPPCPKCPYTLGQVHTLTNPCPGCRLNGYQMYERFLKEQLRETE